MQFEADHISDENSSDFTFSHERIYLPAANSKINTKEFLAKYTKIEFPDVSEHAPIPSSAVYSIPRVFKQNGERQAALAEAEVFNRLLNLNSTKLHGLWAIFLHSACYAGHSFRNRRIGKLMIREHDFVIFAKYQGNSFMAIVEVKSTNDSNTVVDNLERTSDSKVIKNNKRSAQHQLRDHIEVLNNIKESSETIPIQTYIMWPFLSAYTKDTKGQVTKRWKEDNNLHVFEDVISNQDKFNEWFFVNVLQPDVNAVKEDHFITLFSRYIILSCGAFVDEICQGMVALLTQEQLQLMNDDFKKLQGAVVVHGAAGTGKTLLVLRKLQQLYQTGQLNDQNRALFVCYWPGIRNDMESKFKALGFADYVDTARLSISNSSFLKGNHRVYKHIFVDESEAMTLSFSQEIIRHILSVLYERYHKGNCSLHGCPNSTIETDEDMKNKITQHNSVNWGLFWFTVDINQASVFFPKFFVNMLQTPTITLNKVMRTTGSIYNFFKPFYKTPIQYITTANENKIQENIQLGHTIQGPPVYWVNLVSSIDEVVANVVIDLCATKGIKPNDIWVIPFLLNDNLRVEKINERIDMHFVDNTFRPRAVKDVDYFMKNKGISEFLISWVLMLKGLDSKVVIMAIDKDDFDINDIDDRNKAYILVSRSSCLLILVCLESIRRDIDVNHSTVVYSFGLQTFKGTTC